MHDASGDANIPTVESHARELQVATHRGKVLGPFWLAQYTPTSAWELEHAPAGLAFREGGNPYRLNSIFVPWTELRRLQAIEPWPLLHVRSAARGAVYEETYGPCSRSLRDVVAFEKAVLKVIGAARRRVPLAVVDGWDVVAPSPWEPVDQLPADQTSRAAKTDAAFRANARPADDSDRHIVARRDRIASFGWLDVLLFGRGGQGLDLLMPREARVTADGELYVRWRDGRCSRLPVRAVRTSADIWTGPAVGIRDTLYTFGRATYLVLPDAHTCPVAALLDDTLRNRASGSAAR